MTSYTTSPSAAEMVAHQVISERVADAEVRSRARAARVARRTSRRA